MTEVQQATEGGTSKTPLKKKVTLKSKKVGYKPTDEQEEGLDEITPLSAQRTPRLSIDKTGESKKVNYKS